MSAYEKELQACLPDLWRYGYALTRNRDVADDLVQDCAERALRKRRLWQPTGPLKPWLMKMLLNLYRNQLRSQSRRPVLVEMTHETGLAEDPLPARLALGETARTIQSLPEDQRQALLLVVLGGLSYKEAAATLEIPQGTLMSRIARARATLRAEMSSTAPTGKQAGS